jgi:hypothetical protein
MFRMLRERIERRGEVRAGKSALPAANAARAAPCRR